MNFGLEDQMMIEQVWSMFISWGIRIVLKGIFVVLFTLVELNDQYYHLIGLDCEGDIKHVHLLKH